MSGKRAKSLGAKYLGHIIAALDYLADDAEVQAWCGPMSNSCRNWSVRLGKQSGKDPENWAFHIAPSWRIELQDLGGCGCGDNAALLLGASVRVVGGRIEEQAFPAAIAIKKAPDYKYENGDPCCFLCFEKEYVLARRFHFDFDRMKSRYPCSHLQYGGSLATGSSVDDTHYCLHRKIERPRLPHAPVDLVIVLHEFLCCFGTRLANLARDSRWRKLVRASECLLLKDYYAGVLSFLKNRKNMAERLQSLRERDEAYAYIMSSRPAALKKTDTLHDYLCCRPR